MKENDNKKSKMGSVASYTIELNVEVDVKGNETVDQEESIILYPNDNPDETKEVLHLYKNYIKEVYIDNEKMSLEEAKDKYDIYELSSLEIVVTKVLNVDVEILEKLKDLEKSYYITADNKAVINIAYNYEYIYCGLNNACKVENINVSDIYQLISSFPKNKANLVLRGTGDCE